MSEKPTTKPAAKAANAEEAAYAKKAAANIWLPASPITNPMMIARVINHIRSAHIICTPIFLGYYTQTIFQSQSPKPCLCYNVSHFFQGQHYAQ